VSLTDEPLGVVVEVRPLETLETAHSSGEIALLTDVIVRMANG
jgi:hypothetical protein